MNTRPTPETDAAWACFKGYMEPLQDVQDLSRKLERERDEWKAKYIQQNKDLGCELRDPNGTIWDYAKTLQRERDEAREALKTGGMLNIIDRAAHERAAAIRERDEARAESIRWQSIAEGRGRTDEEEQLAIAESQLASYKARYIKLAGKYAIETHEITAQRDRLAEALKEIYNVSSFDYDTMPELARKKYREVVLEMADEALPPLTPKSQ